METQIKTNHNKGISLLFLILMLLLSVNLHAVTELFLRADTATMTMPDGRQIHMWGFAQDSAFGAHDGTVTVPGPVLTIDPAETHLIITLENNLPEPVSLIIPGQVAPVAPVSFTDDRGRQRIQSFTHETPVDNVDPVVYEWTNLRPGTFLYQSGSHPALQVQMGLYGGLKKDFADLPVKQAYTGIEYDNDVMLVFSEIDPAVHDAVLANDFGPGKTMTSTINYEPKYFLINGQSYTSAQAPLPVGQINDRILLRLVNAGIKSHVPCLQYLRGEVVAEDGFAYNFPGDQYAIDLPPAKTKDVRIVPSAVGTYLLYDHALGLVNNTSLGGGMMVKLNVGSPVPVIHAVTATPAAIWDTQTSQLLVDATDPDGLPSPLSYNWIIPIGAGSVSDPTLANPVYTPADVATTQVFTLTVEVTDGATTVSSTVDVTVMENVLPIINSVTATPASILDTQTSQLQANATDSDNGPSPLAYNWIVPVGAGSVSDPAIANPIYTPADVATTQIFTLTVEVSDGLATVNSTVDVTVNNTPVGNISPVINSVTATPASILDTQTSQLAVDASDADNGPSPLSYNWIVPVGAGSVSDPAIANPIYTPADVATTQIFTLTVEVSDGSATVSSTVDVTVNDTPVVNIPPVISSVTATPASILDTQTSQLQANATDADNGPSPLSYNWIVPVGAGSVSDPAIANPIYTPAEVATTQIFTLTVEVSDGSATVSSTVDVTVNDTPVVNIPPVISSVTATPASILDTQTSQLQANATDADNGPSPLSYNWIVPVGAGSVSDPAIANPIYTPADVATTQIFTLTVEVSDGLATVSSTVDVTVSDGLLFSANFNAGMDGFAYFDDLFYNTTQPLYASGQYIGTGGYSGGALQINLGGINNTVILGMSGGWQTTFNLTEPTTVKLAFRYNLTQTAHYENTEFSNMMLSIDNALIGTATTDYVRRITGNGNGGGIITTGWQLYETIQTLPAGLHTINIGGYNNRKNSVNEETTVLIDDVLLVRN